MKIKVEEVNGFKVKVSIDGVVHSDWWDFSNFEKSWPGDNNLLGDIAKKVKFHVSREDKLKELKNQEIEII